MKNRINTNASENYYARRGFLQKLKEDA